MKSKTRVRNRTATIAAFAYGLAGLLAIGGMAHAYDGELGSDIGPKAPCIHIPESSSRHVGKICIRYKLAYRLTTLLGEPIIENRVAWELERIHLRQGGKISIGSFGTDASVLGAMKELRLADATFSARLMNIDPLSLPFRAGALKGSGEGFGFGTPGSPDWGRLFMNAETSCSDAPFLEASDAKEVYRRGVSLMRLSVCKARFDGLHSVDTALENACIVEPARSEERCADKMSFLPALLRKPIETIFGSEPDVESVKEAGRSFVGYLEKKLDDIFPSREAARQEEAARKDAEAALSGSRRKIEQTYASAIDQCENSKPERPVEKTRALVLTAETRNPCLDVPRGEERNACLEERKRRIEAGKRAAAEKRMREKDEYRRRLAAYERDIEVWPQTLATCKDNAKKAYTADLDGHRKVVGKETARLVAIRETGAGVREALAEALRPER